MKRLFPLVATAILGLALMSVSRPAPAEAKASKQGAAKLSRFTSCKQFNRYAANHPRSLRYPSGGFGFLNDSPSGGEGGAPAPSRDGGSAPTSTQGTNVQEAGVDEPDIVKASGSTLFALAKGQLHSVDAGPAGPALLDSIKLPGDAGSYYYGYGAELLIAGDRALVITNSGYAFVGADPAPRSFAPYAPQSMIAELDISDPSAMRITRTMRLEGSYVSSRLTGSTARVVVSATPQYPAGGDREGARGDVIAREPARSASRSRRAGKVEHRGPKWLPTALVNNRLTGRKVARPIAPCTRVRRPQTFSGLDTLTVLTIDLARGLPAVDSDAITTSGQIIYGSTESLYVATENWYDPAKTPSSISDVSTEIHRFSASKPDQTSYRSSGEVPGFMLSQWSMSEHEDVLRVASTTSPPWRAGRQSAKSQSFVTSLADSDGKLEEIGRLGGLGVDERIYAVRFIGEVGYVVTFRQVDPLYTLDLSDPGAPKVLGELKIPGYSAYLHPVGDGLLLGVGQSATEEGRLLGSQLSLFDNSDLADPKLIEQQTIAPGAYSEVENDHHAFLFHSSTALAVVPIDSYDEDTGEQLFSGAIGYRVEAGGIDEVGRVTHGSGEHMAQVRRSLVLGERLFTLSNRSIVASDLTTLAPEGEARFPAAR